MYPGSLPSTLSLFSIAVLTGVVALYAFRRTGRAGANSFGGLMVAITLWVAAYAFETSAPTLQAKILAEKVSYLGIAATPTLWFVFALDYTGNTKWLRGKTKIFLTAWPLAVFATALTNDFHHWMWRSASLAPNGLPALVFEGFGPAFWFAVVISYFFILSGISLYGIAYQKSTHVFRQQIGIMILGSLVPLFSDVIYLTTNLQNRGLDWTPFSFALSVILLAIGFFRYDLLNLIPLAGPLVIENMPDAVVAVDDQDRIVNLNPAAYQWLNTNKDVIGQDAHEVLKGMEVLWEHWDAPEAQFDLEIGEGAGRRWFHLMISSIRDRHGRPRGRVLVARDRTLEQESLEADHRHIRQMELLNSITRAALESTDFHQTLQTLADQLGGILEAEGTYITLWDQAAHRAIPVAAYGKARDSYASTQIDPHEHTLTESVLRAGHSLPIDDVLNTSYMSPSVAERFPSRSILALPLIANEEKLGAALIAFDHIHHFTPDEIALGDVVGPQVALAIYKARLLDDSYHRIKQLALLDEVSKRVADSLDEKEILLRTVEAVIDRFGYAQAAISLLVDHDELEAMVISGTDQIGFSPGFRQKVGEGIVGHTAETRLAYLTEDVEKDPFYFTIGKRSGSAAGVPMLDEGQLLGVLYVESTLRNAFKQDDIQTLQTLISHVGTAVQKARLFARAQERLRTITTLQSISQAVSSTLELQVIFQTVVQLLKDAFDYTHVCIYLLDDQILRFGYQVGYPEEAVLHEIPLTSGVIGRTARTKQTQFITDVTKDPDFLRVSYEIESEISVPLLKEGNVLGVINIEAAPGCRLTENDVDLMTALAGPVAIAVDNARLHTEVKSLALTDALTNLLNRRAFDEALATEIARADRYGYPMAMIIIDLDNFKSYNDRWGHPAGDKRLMEVAELLEANVRSPDIAARYGGEEFAIILPCTSRSGALILAERLRRGAEALAVEKVESDCAIPGYTISLGVATLPENGRTASDLLIAADDAELAAKRLGKNRVCIANDPHDSVEHK